MVIGLIFFFFSPRMSFETGEQGTCICIWLRCNCQVGCVNPRPVDFGDAIVPKHVIAE